jgi:hypothetical protein
MSGWISVEEDLPAEGITVIVIMNDGSDDYCLSFARLNDFESGSWSTGYLDSHGQPYLSPIYVGEVLYWHEINWDELIGLTHHVDSETEYDRGFKAGEQSAINKILGLLGKEMIDNANEQLYT